MEKRFGRDRSEETLKELLKMFATGAGHAAVRSIRGGKRKKQPPRNKPPTGNPRKAKNRKERKAKKQKYI